VLVNPSFSESFGMSLVEAMACNVPVVATRAGGMPEIVVHGETGHMLEPGETEAIAAAILDCIDSRDRRDTLGRAGRARALQVFSWDARVAGLETAYTSRTT
jgi:glycosyltransferase involved in cell wall biosynthesis